MSESISPTLRALRVVKGRASTSNSSTSVVSNADSDDARASGSAAIVLCLADQVTQVADELGAVHQVGLLTREGSTELLGLGDQLQDGAVVADEFDVNGVVIGGKQLMRLSVRLYRPSVE